MLDQMTTKRCTKCLEEKTLNSFAPHRECKLGVNSYCKSCDAIRFKKWRSDNKVVIASKKRDYLLRARYGIDREFYEYLLRKQGGKCAICENVLGTKDGHRLAVDHCHKTKKVRGLLCKPCNNAIGLFRENLKIMKNAIKYLASEVI